MNKWILSLNEWCDLQLRLNVERLKSERGVHTAEQYFKDIKFMGKGHERHDLNNVMKRLEHWAHRLYPNFNFDDFIGTCEKLGKKKDIQRHMYRYRQGMLEPEATAKGTEDDDNDGDNADAQMDPIDELDEIIDQQIQNYSVAPPKTPRTPAPGHSTTFDSIRSSVIGTPKFMSRRPVEASTPLSYHSNDLGVRPLAHTPGKTAPAAAQLTSEQMARIAENRRLAQERLKAKREREAQEQKEQEAAKQMQQIDEEQI